LPVRKSIYIILLFPSRAEPQCIVTGLWQGTLGVQAVIMQLVQLCQSRFST